MKHTWKLITMALLLLACAGMPLFQPTPTSTPLPTATATIEPTETSTPLPSATSTPDRTAEYLSLVPEIPVGFEWKIIPENDLAVVVPDGWFFKEETRADLNLDGVYVTKENIAETGRFSTGLSVFLFKDFKDHQEADQFAMNILAQQANMETTREVLNAWDHQSGSFIIHHLRIRGEYPYETEVNQKKVVHYSATVANNTVYWSIFESPEDLWDQTVKDFGIVLDYIVVFGH